MPLTVIPLVSKLSTNVIRILGCNPSVMTLQGTNTYLVGTGKRILIDAGDKDTAPEYTKVLDDVLRKENATIGHLVITHWHHDHIGGARSVRDLVQTKAASPIAIWKFRRTSADGGDDEENYDVGSWLALKDQQSLEVEGASLRVKYTPGHTTDHVCLMLQNDDILFSGDCILGEGTAVFEDLKDYMVSLENILAMKPKTIYPGHGPVIQDPAPKINFYIRHRIKRENEIFQILGQHGTDSGMSEMDIVSHIYKETPKNLWPAAAINVGHHLEKLVKEGKVRKSEGSLWFVVPKES